MCGEAWPRRCRMVILLQDLGQPWTSFARCSALYTDSFLMISGLLTSYSFYKQLERTKWLDIPREYVSRLMRYSTEFCVNFVRTFMRYKTQLCVKYVSRLMRCVQNVVLLLHVAIYHTHHPPNTTFSLTTNNCSVKSSNTATITRYSNRNKLLPGGNVLGKCHDLLH